MILSLNKTAVNSIFIDGGFIIQTFYSGFILKKHLPFLQIPPFM